MDIKLEDWETELQAGIVIVTTSGGIGYILHNHIS